MREEQAKAEEQLIGLRAQIASLARDRASLMNEAVELRDKRDRMNSERREVTGQLRELRARERQLKDQLYEVRGRIAEVKKAAADAREEFEKAAERVGEAKAVVGTKPEEVDEELRDLEWEHQTSPTDMAREKELMKRVVELSVEKQRHQRISQLELSLAGAQAKRLGTRLSLDKDWDALRDLRGRLDPLRKQIDGLSAQADSLRSKADEAHQYYIEKKAAADAISARIGEVAAEEKALRERLEASLRAKEKSEMKAIAGEVRKKLGRGDKITFQELQALRAEEEE